MKKGLILVNAVIIMMFSCEKDDITYSTNGETIFRTGKNLNGKVLQDLENSEKNGKAHSCVDCHGSNGKGKNNTGSITFADLSNPALHSIVYNDSLLIRFLDHELKSDGSIANTGVIWKMDMQEKSDLIAFLKTL